MSQSITESVVEDAALDWLRGLGYEILSGLVISPGELAAERTDYKEVLLFDHLPSYKIPILAGECYVPLTVVLSVI